MFDRYTQRARLSIFFARKAVSEYGSPLIETEYLLLGMLESDASVIRLLLQSKTTEEIRAEVEKGIVRKPEIPLNIDVRLSAEGEAILSFASEEAETLRHQRIDIAHLVAGMLREQNGVAGQVLRSAGVSLEAVRQQLSLGEAETE
jgi:ATP-dependent Clp protease ATP-binding subunit ClpC